MSSIDGVKDLSAYTPEQVAAVWRVLRTAPSDLTVGELRAWVVEAAEDVGGVGG